MAQQSNRLMKGTLIIIILLWFYSGTIGGMVYGAVARVSLNGHVKALYSTTGIPANAMDGNFTTYCEATGLNSWFMLALDDTITLDNIAIAYASGATRTYYLSIQVSLDSTNWITVLTDTSRGNTNHYETFKFEECRACYIRINGFGSNKSVYTLWGEVYLPPLNSSIDSQVQHETPLRMLFIGNSYTLNGSVPFIVQDIAATHGWPAPSVKYYTIGNSTLGTLRDSSKTLEYINEGNWDFVVLQDHSRRTFSDTLQMWDDITWFYDTIKASNPNATVVLYETWATLEPYSRNEQIYQTRDPLLLTEWNAMQNGITLDYEKAALHIVENAEYPDKNDTLIARVGEKWQAVLNSDTLFRLHLSGDNHANDTGIYLNALSIYNAIYRVYTEGAGYWKISEHAAGHLQGIVDSASIHCGLNDETDIIEFSISGLVYCTVNIVSHTVTVTMPYGTIITSLTPFISLSKGAIIFPMGNITRDFTNPETYTVTSENGQNQQVWTITVLIAADSTATDVLNFSIPDQVRSTVTILNHTVTIIMPYGTDITSLTPLITLSEGATIFPLINTARDFTIPETYTVTSLNGKNQQDWLVTVFLAADSTATDIIDFSIPPQVSSTINFINHTIAVIMPYGTVLNSLTPLITLSEGATINPASEAAADFSSPVTYTVIALNGIDQQDWIIEVAVENDLGLKSSSLKKTITIFPNPARDFCKISVNSMASESYTISILDMSGRSVFHSDQFSGAAIVTIPINQLKPGFYNVISSNNTSVIDYEKLIVY